MVIALRPTAAAIATSQHLHPCPQSCCHLLHRPCLTVHPQAAHITDDQLPVQSIVLSSVRSCFCRTTFVRSYCPGLHGAPRADPNPAFLNELDVSVLMLHIYSALSVARLYAWTCMRPHACHHSHRGLLLVETLCSIEYAADVCVALLLHADTPAELHSDAVSSA